MPSKKKLENALNIQRMPSSIELFNVGRQPSIPTRGLSSILSGKKKVEPFRMDF